MRAASTARAMLQVAMALLLAACGDWNRARIDGEWFRRNLEEAHLKHWLAAAPTPNGFFRTALSRRWQPLPRQPGDLVGQARALYVLTAGVDLTGDPAYLEQVRRGADFILTAYADPVNGGFFEAVTADGRPANRNKRLYTQATALFALAHAYRVTRDTRYREAAAATWRTIQDKFGDAEGGFRAGTNEDFTETKLSNSQNPVMHLFEALLALHDAGDTPEALPGAGRVARFVVGRLLQGRGDGAACIPEEYGAGWKPARTACGGGIELGHQFEWGFMLSAAAERGLDPVYAEVAARLLKYAVAEGYDHTDSGVFTRVDEDGKVDRRKFWWQQAEGLRALMHHAAMRDRGDLWGLVTQMTEFVRNEELDADNGGWFLRTRGDCARGDCPDAQPDGYHMTAMHMEAIRLAKSGR